MQRAFTIGRIVGIPLKFQLNWFITVALVSWSLAIGYFPLMYPDKDAGFYWFFGLLTALLFFSSVLMHEVGHAVVSVGEGVAVRSITLFVFGGMAHISREPPTPRSEFRIVAAGPLTSLILALLFLLISRIAAEGMPVLEGVARYLAEINLILAVFNLIPGFPLDGGRLLRSALWKWKGDFRWATRWATNVGLAISGLAIAGGFALILFGYILNGIWVIFIGWYLSHMARESYKHSIQYENWQTHARRVQPEKLASISLVEGIKSYRSAVVRVETVDHTLHVLPQTGAVAEETQ